jgi:hypothetical protein
MPSVTAWVRNEKLYLLSHISRQKRKKSKRQFLPLLLRGKQYWGRSCIVAGKGEAISGRKRYELGSEHVGVILPLSDDDGVFFCTDGKHFLGICNFRCFVVFNCSFVTLRYQ